MTSNDATSSSATVSDPPKPLGAILDDTREGGVLYMDRLVEFWMKIVDDVCGKQNSKTNSSQNPWQQKWHRKFFEELLLFTNMEYDRANTTREEYLLSLHGVQDSVIVNTVSLQVDSEIWKDPLWLAGRVSPTLMREKMEAHEAELQQLANLEEKSLTSSWYFQSLTGSDTYDINELRKYAEHLVLIWDGVRRLWTEDENLARETHPDAYVKFAIRARRAWLATRIVEEKLNILFNEIPEEDSHEKESLQVFSNGNNDEHSRVVLGLLTEDQESVNVLDSKFDFEWTLS